MNFIINRQTQVELSNEQLLTRAPSIFSENHRQSLSDKYKQVKTIDVINTMRDNGWYPVLASEVRVKSDERKGFQKHLISFAKKEGNGFLEIREGLYPRTVLTNSHDGLCSYSLMAGIFRLICSNGLIVSDSTFESIKVKHIGFDMQEIINGSQKVIESFPKIANRIESFQKIELSQTEKIAYAKASAIAKYGDLNENKEENEIAKEINVDAILYPRRNDDRKNDLWTTYNVIQENLIKGGRREVRQGYKSQRAREVKAIDKNIIINRALWALTEEMAKLKTA
jgi:hypothetical protein